MWSIAKGILWLLDGFFDIIDEIWRFKFFDNDYVNTIFGGAIIVACSWLVLKVVLELVMNYIIKNDGRESPLSVYRGVILAIVMMFLIPSLFTFGHSVSTELTDAVIETSGIGGSDEESTISSALIKAMVYEDETESSDITYLVKNWKTIEINTTDGGILGIGDVYLYSVNFFMLIVLAIITIFLLFFVAIQMAKRVMEIALFKIIAPFCCTSLTNNNSKSFETWSKSTMGLFLITVVQFVSIGLLLEMFGSSFSEVGTMTGIFLIIGALLFIISTPTLISSLLGQQSGMMTAFGDMQSLMALGSGVSSGLSLAGAGLSSALGTGASVMKSATGGMSGGVSNMFNKLSSSKGNLNTTQMSDVKSSLNQHDRWGAYQKTKDYTRENLGQEKPTFNNPYKNPFSLKYNPLKNQYMNSNSLEANSNFDRKWY